MKKARTLLTVLVIMAACVRGDAGAEILPRCGKVSRETCPSCPREGRVVYAVLPCRPAAEVQAGALSLSTCYALALKQSEIIAISADLIKQADARFLQAISIMLPHASFISEDNAEQQGPPPSVSSAATSAEFQSQEPTRSSVRRFNANQTLFNGFKAFAAMKGSKYDKSRRIDEKIRAEQLLLVDVANAFYLVIEKREDLRVLERIRAALDDRVGELRGREKLGRSRPSEITNAKAQFYTVESTIEVSRNQETLARQLLEFLIGQPVHDLIDPYDIPATIQPESYYVMKSDLRPDVQAAKYAAMVAKEEYRAVDSDFLPTVKFDANGYTQRTGFNKGVDWDVSLRVDAPIFDGGYTLGRSKEYALRADQSELEFKRIRRRAPFDIKDAYASLMTALRIHDSLRKTFTTAKLNYHLQGKDYSRSLVSNLDVLAAIQTLQDAQRNYIHALYEAKRLYWQLRVSVGEGITETLNDAF